MTEDYVRRFEKAMKKGFMSMLVMTILEKKPLHGYGIMQEIEELTLGLWKPPASTMYTILKKLRENNLIYIMEEEEAIRGKKVYRLTSKGEETLKKLIKKQRKMMKGMRSIIISTFGVKEEEFPSEDIEQFINPPIMFGKFKPESKEEKRNLLEKRKKFLEMRIKHLKNILQNIEKQLDNLQKNE